MNAPITTRLLDIYRIGPGPSSSHTVGPMRAAGFFRDTLIERGLAPTRIGVDLLGSLSATGGGHGTVGAVLGGLVGLRPETCDPDELLGLPARLRENPNVAWVGGQLRCHPDDVVCVPFAETAPSALAHPNTLVLRAFGRQGEILHEEVWCSVGGGFVAPFEGGSLRGPPVDAAPLPHPFHDGRSLLDAARKLGGGFGDIVLANERAREADPEAVGRGLDAVWEALCACIDRGLDRRGELPGGLGVRRRAPDLLARVEAKEVEAGYAHIARAQAYAFAVTEENAAGGRVVTAPTNGAAGILPGVLREAAERLSLERARIHGALATAGAVAMIIRAHASLSGAEVGCQGEVGSATSMAAAALCELLGGEPAQVEYAAEIAMEHNLGLTCDPIGGLVQAPCIERNAMGVAKAWSAAQLALHSEGAQLVSLDRVIQVMRRTGADMRGEYKETSRGGLAVSLPEC